jgi:uncharacterized protein (UPF0264 family)
MNTGIESRVQSPESRAQGAHAPRSPAKGRQAADSWVPASGTVDPSGWPAGGVSPLSSGLWTLDSGLLVSVRSAQEARVALCAGASLIDIKEPTRGSLGRPDPATVAEIQRVVAGRLPISVALGELRDLSGPLGWTGIRYVKWGLAGLAPCAVRWQDRATSLLGQLPPGCEMVPVAYADWQRAQAPAPEVVCQYACSGANHPLGAFLLDTWKKDGTTLLDWLDLPGLQHLRDLCARAGLPLALAGSLGEREIARLGEVQPTWFAVRGAVCTQGRTSTVAEAKVRRLVKAIRENCTRARRELTGPAQSLLETPGRPSPEGWPPASSFPRES